MRYLVTGGAGFIGSNFVRELLQRQQQVRVLDNFSTGRRQNLKPFERQMEIVDGDIRDFWTTLDACRDVDIVLHQAALPSVFRSVENPTTTTGINIMGTLNVLECSRRQGVKRLMFASSSSVYGDTPVLPKSEEMVPTPLSPYAASKLTGEHFCRIYADLFGLAAIVFRYFNVFGPNQNPDSEYAAVIPKFITALLRDQRPTVFGDGEQSRDFTYVDNVVQMVLAVCEQNEIKSGVYNLACGAQYTLNQLLERLFAQLNKKIEAHYTESRPGDVRHSYADVSKLKQDFGLTPTVSFEEGLKRTVAFFEQEQMAARSV